MSHLSSVLGGARGHRRLLRNQPIRVKLAVILLLPVFAILALAGLSVASAADRAEDAGQAHELVALGGVAARLAAALQQERSSATLVFIEAGNPAALQEYRQAGEVTDGLAAEFRAGRAGARIPVGLAPLLDRLDANLVGLIALREQVASAPDAVLSTTAFWYRATIADLLSYRQSLGQSGAAADTADGLRASAALSGAIESIGQLQVAAVRAMSGGALTPAAQQEIVAANTGISEAMEVFADLGEPEWSALLNRSLSGSNQVLLSERLQSLVVRSQPGSTMALGVDARQLSAAIGARMALLHEVESDVDTQLLAAVDAERDAQLRSIYTSSATVAGVLVIVLAIAWVMASSLSRSLTRLQIGAIEVASQRLPQMVTQLNVESADPVKVRRLMAVAAEPIPVDGTDEVGRVGEAFNAVTASAARVAGEQAVLRAAVGAILLALSRRLQLQADSMMRSLDALERREVDPERLEKLFDLDHTAVLLRRFIFNLQVLAGGRSSSARSAPEALEDVIRAAGQQIHQYRRVAATAADQSVLIRGEAVDDLVHLLAELLDNATRFSPPETLVQVEALRVGDQLHIQIRDQGNGMTEGDLSLVRDRIANPHRLDRSTTQHMGLPVAGALAHRLGVKIEYRSIPRNGTWVDLTVPAAMLDRPHQPAVAAREPTAVLAPVSAASTGAPTWTPTPAKRLPQTPAVIYEQLVADPSRSWFQARTERRPAPWQESLRAAGPATVSEWTRSGLPVRAPGSRAFPTVGAPNGQPALVKRDPERARLQMRAMQTGLGRAGRRQVDNR